MSEMLGSFDMEPCQTIGGSVASIGHEGMFVPSARARGTNLVVFPQNLSTGFRFETIDEEIIAPDGPSR